MPVASKPLCNSLWIVGGRLASGLVTAVVIGALARHLGPDGFGRLNLVITIIAIAMPWASLTLGGIVVRELMAAPPERAGAILGTAFGLRFVAGVIAIGVLTVGARMVLPEDWALVGLASLSLLFQPAGVVDFWFQRHLASRRTVLVHSIVIYAGAGLKLALVVAGAPLEAFIGMIVVEAIGYAVGFMVAYRSDPSPAGRWIWDAGLARVMAKETAPLAAAGVLGMLGTRLDQVLVATRLGEHETGLYLGASRFIEFVLFSGAAVLTSVYPRLAEARRNAAVFGRQVQAMFDALGIMGWAAGIGFTLAAGPIVKLVLGPAFAGTVPILIAQGWMALLVLSAMARWDAVVLTASTGWNLLAAALTIATQFVLVGLALTRFGAVGAAYVAGAAAFVGGIATSWLVPALRPVAGAQLRALGVVFAPSRWGEVRRLFTQ